MSITFDIMPGDYGLVSVPGRGGRLIRIGQWLNGDGFVKYQHAFIYIGNGRIIEAAPKGARESSLSKYAKRTIAWYSCPYAKVTISVPEEARKLIGTPYSWTDYWAIAAVRLRLPRATKLLRKKVASEKSMICSQLVDEAYLRSGWHLFTDNRLPGDVTPADLWWLIVRQQNG